MLLHDELRRGARKESFLIAVACVGGVILVVVGGAIGREGGVEDHFSSVGVVLLLGVAGCSSPARPVAGRGAGAWAGACGRCDN